MTARQFLTNITVILTVMAAGALLETVVPMLAAKPWKQDRRAANLRLTALSFGSNWLLASLAAAAALVLRPAGLMARFGWPLWIETIAGIVVLDFSVGYLSHRAMHMWPVMWRFHQIHHSDRSSTSRRPIARTRSRRCGGSVRDRARLAARHSGASRHDPTAAAGH
jgi:sterol desaturase/sphingolipid hydroxylase (fatty acid hydroxylase superfamily)